MLTSASYAATTHTWAGNGPDNLWSRPGNWANASVPPANTSVILIFPPYKPKKSSVNNIAGLTVLGMEIRDYGMQFAGTGAGSPLKLNGIVSIDPGSLEFKGSLGLSLVGATTFSLKPSLGFGVGTNFNVTQVTFGSAISGNASLTVVGDAPYCVAAFTAQGNNSYGGVTKFEDNLRVFLNNWGYAPGPTPLSLVIVGKISVPTSLTIKNKADVTYERSSQIADSATVTLLQNSRLDLYKYSDTISSFTCKGRLEFHIDSASTYGKLTVNGTASITSQAEADWNDQLGVSRNLNYQPVANTTFTLINNDSTDAVSGTFYGWPQAQQITLGGVAFKLSYNGGTGNDITLKNP